MTGEVFQGVHVTTCHNNKKLLFPRQAPSPFVLEGLWTGAGRTRWQSWNWILSLGGILFHVTEWPGRLVGCAVTSLDREPFSNTHKHTLKYICSLFLPYVSSLRTLHRRTFTCRHSQRPSPCSPSIAIERSISHFTASYTFLCHSQLLLHSNGRLAQQRRPRGSSPSLLLTHTISNTHQ